MSQTEHPDVQYPISELPRDPDPASKLDIGALRTWWATQPEDASLANLIRDVKAKWSANLPAESWYIALYATLITCGKPASIVPIFKDVVAEAKSAEDVKIVGDRFKAVLMKLWVIIGIVQVVTAVPQLAKAEIAAVIALEPDLDDDAVRVKLNKFLSHEEQIADSAYIHQDTGPALDQKGFELLLRMYRHNLPDIFGSWQRHSADFAWLETRIVYGLALSDFTILSAVEMEIGVMAAIMAQDIHGPTYWHIRGMQRLGVSKEDTNIVIETVKKCAEWAGKELKETGHLTAEDVDVEWEAVPAS